MRGLYPHSYSKDRAAFVFDLMEPLRPVVDRAVLDLVRNQVFEPADFMIRKDGVCRLNPELTKLLVARVEFLWPTHFSPSFKASLLSLSQQTGRQAV
jgi:CRISPR/Cas system-associated endonuclease Cas1